MMSYPDDIHSALHQESQQRAAAAAAMSLSKPLSEFFTGRSEDGVLSGSHSDLSLLYDIQKKRRERLELAAAIEERTQTVRQMEENDEYENILKVHTSLDLFLKVEEAEQVAERAERKCEETAKQREELEKLKKEKMEMIERKQQLKLEVQSHSRLKDMMARLLKFTNFKDVEALTEHMESLIRFKEELVEKEQEGQEKVELMKKQRAAVRNKHHLLKMQRNNELGLLRTELEDIEAETLQLEKQWSHVQDTAAKKTLQLGQIKIATFNLNQMIRNALNTEEDFSMEDTETQLDRVMTFVEDYVDTVKRYQATVGTLDPEFSLTLDHEDKCVSVKK